MELFLLFWFLFLIISCLSSKLYYLDDLRVGCSSSSCDLFIHFTQFIQLIASKASHRSFAAGGQGGTCPPSIGVSEIFGDLRSARLSIFVIDFVEFFTII